MNTDEKRKELEQYIKNHAEEIRLERLGHPYLLSAPKPIHFKKYSKCKEFEVSRGIATGAEVEMFYRHGMPRGIQHVVVTLPGVFYGKEFADFSIELFGLNSEEAQPGEIERLNVRQVGEVKYSNANPDTIPFGGGLFFSASDELGYSVKLSAWRWRVFMDSSSLCLENNWYGDELAGGGWFSYLLGIKYDNPEKMVTDAIRFAPAFRLCNLVEAKTGEKRGGRNHVKVADLGEEIKKALGKRYAELQPDLTDVKKDAKAAFKIVSRDGWKQIILNQYPVLNNHQDLLNEIDPYYIPPNPDGSGGKDPWEIAIEIAAREVIPDYKNNSSGAVALKSAAIMPQESD